MSEFMEKIAKIQAETEIEVVNKVNDMMSKLDYSKHDKRNNKTFVKNILTAHYNSCFDSVITSTQFDNMFAIYSPYNKTY